MRIGVYGDSYGESRGLETNWTNILRERLGWDLDNYSKSGSSLYYSYTKFKETRYLYDAIIFLVTEPNRYPVEVNFSEIVPAHMRNVSSINVVYRIQELFNDKLTALDKQLLLDIEGWYKALDDDYISTVSTLFLEDVSRKHNTVYFYPCFPTSMNDEQLEQNGIDKNYCLFNIWLRQLYELGMLPVSYEDIEKNALNRKSSMQRLFSAGSEENTNVISSHLSPEYNAAFAEIMYDKITTGTYNFDTFENVKLINDRNFYYLEAKE